MVRAKSHIRIANLALMMLAFSAPLCAENIYKYTDENGIVHYTDRAPNDEKQDFETVFMESEPEARVRLRKGGTLYEPIYYVSNDYHGPVEVELTMVESTNILSEPELPARMVLPARKERIIAGFGAEDPAKGFEFKLSLAHIPGKPIARPVSNLVILPPLAPGESYPVSQSFKGGRTHTSPDSEYAIDIVMPVGTPVHAAVGGIVMDVEEDFNRGGKDMKQFGHKANHVRILHDDGTTGLYAHLDLASVLVRRGSRVRAGQIIARSGNTGYSTGPHLHFAIQQNTGMHLISVPYRFKRPEGEPSQPTEGEYLEGLEAQ